MYTNNYSSSMAATKRRRISPSGRKLSMIPEEAPCAQQQQISTAATPLDSLVASVFGLGDWDQGQNEVDLEILYRLQRPDLQRSDSHSKAPIFGLVNWAREAAFEAQEAQLAAASAAFDQCSISPIDLNRACYERMSSVAELSDSDSDDSQDHDEAILHTARTISMGVPPAHRQAPRAPRIASFRLPLELHTSGLGSPMMTPVNTPMSSVPCC